MTYQVLNKTSIIDYVERQPDIIKVLGPVSHTCVVEEIGDGNLNYVYKLTNPDRSDTSVILKQAVPYLRMAGEDWPLSRDRMTYEIRSLQTYNQLVPDFVPSCYHSDVAMSVIVMEFLNEHTVLRYEMIKGVIFPEAGRKIGRFLADTLFQTSAYGMESIKRRELMGDFVQNAELCKLTEEFIFTFPFMEHDSNYKNPRTNQFASEHIYTDSDYQLKVLHFKELFLTKSDALLHGDLHTGSIMANKDDLRIIDGEFAFFGPFGFDIGKIIANFLLNCTAHFFLTDDVTKRTEYQNWLLAEAMDIWVVFQEQFTARWDEQNESAMFEKNTLMSDPIEKFKAQTMGGIFQDAIGFCACSLARRTLGIAGVADIRDITDLDARSTLEIFNLNLSKLLMREQNKLQTIDQLDSLLRAYYSEFSFE